MARTMSNLVTGKRKRGFKTPVARALPSKKLAAQVKQLMRMRQEKKFVDLSGTGNVGQVAANLPGALISGMLGAIPQGDGESQRIGNSITATGMVFKQQFIKQASATGTIRARTHMVRVLDPSMSGNDVLEAVFDVNAMSGVRDYFSSLNYTMMRDKRVKILGSAQTVLNTDSSSGGPTSGIITIPIKFDDETIRYEGDATSYAAAIRYYAVTTTDLGNSSGSASTQPVFVTATTSGLQTKFTNRVWYTDS